MKRLFKIGALTLVGAVLLLVVAGVVASLVVDPNDYREQIAAQIKQRTGREVRIEGDLRMTFLPWLGVETGRIEVGGAPGFGDAPFAVLDSAQVRVKLLPLLSREVEMDTVVVRGLELNLARNEQGVGNWEDLAAGQDGTATDDSGKALAAFALGGVALENASVRFTDAQAGLNAQVSALNARTGAISLNAPVDAALDFDFAYAGNGRQLNGKAKGSTAVALSPSDGRITLSALAMDVSTNAPELAPGSIETRLEGSLSYDTGTRQLSGKDLTLKLDAPAGNVTGLGALALTAGADMDLRLAENTLAMPRLTLSVPALSRDGAGASLNASTTLVMNLDTGRLALKQLDARGDVTRAGKTLPYTLSGDLAADLPAGSAEMSGLRLGVGDLSASGEVKVANMLSGSPLITGALVSEPFAARTLLADAGIAIPPMRDPNALGEAAVSSGFSFQGKELVLDPLTLTVDGSTLRGRVASPDLAAGALRFSLASERLDVDRYLPPDQAAAPPSAAGAIPVELLRGLDVVGDINVASLRYAGLDLAKVNVGIKAQQQKLVLSPLSAQVAGGSYAGNVRVDASQAQPVIRIDEKISKMDLDSVLRALGVSLGRIDLRGGRSDIAVAATLTASADGKQVNARGVTLDAKLGGPSLPGGSLPLGFKGDLDVDLAASHLRMSSMTANVSNLAASGNVEVANFNAQPSYNAELSVPAFDLRTLAKRFGLPVPRTGNPKAFTAVAFNGTLKGDTSSVEAGPMTVKLDGSTVAGRASVRNFLAPAIAFDLEVDRLDMDDYLPPRAQGKAATPGAAALVLPVDLVRALNVNGNLKVNALNFGGLKLNGVTVKATADNSQLKLSPAGASLYGGRYDGNVTVNAQRSQPVVSLDETIQGVDIGALLRDLRGDAPVTGTTDLRAVLTATGGDSADLLRSVNGDVSFTVREGTLPKVDVVDAMCGALASFDFDRINKKTLAAGLASLLLKSVVKPNAAAAGTPGDATHFTSLTGSARITNGVARNDDLNMTSPVVRVSGSGIVDLPNESVDYQANAELVQDCAGIGKRDLAGQIIPVRVTGPLSNPKVQPTIPAGLIQALVKRRSEQAPAPAPAAAAPLPSPSLLPGLPLGQQPAQEQAEPQQPELPVKRGHVIKDARDQILKGILGNILNKQ